MSEKYSRISEPPENLYTQGSPLLIKKGALLRNNETGSLLVQLKLSSLSDKEIKLAKVEISCLDALGRALGAPIVHEYLDLSAQYETDFGAQKPIRIGNPATRSFTARVTEVGFSDNSVWSAPESAWEPLPEQGAISEIIDSSNALIAYRATFGDTAKHAVLEHKDLWLCTCGKINSQSEPSCRACGASLSELKAIDPAALELKGKYLSAVKLYNGQSAKSLKEATLLFQELGDYLDSAEYCEKCAVDLRKKDADAVIAAKKRGKIIKLSAIFSGVAIALCLLGYFVAYPMISKATGNYAPYINMYNVKDFKIPDGTKEIKDDAFEDCDSLLSITIPDSVTSIGGYAFDGCSSLENVTFGENSQLTSIGGYAFDGCSSLTSITIPSSVTSIGNCAFRDCSSLTSITIPENVTSIGSSAFDGCSSLTSITIPESVTSIDYRAFSGCSSLTSITIPESITSIDEYAFAGCSSLTSITIPDSVTSIGKDAFYYCKSLTSITIPDSVTSIGSSAFRDCSSLESITIPDSVTSIGYGVFWDCTSLTSITIPESVTSIDEYAFRDCSSLTYIKYYGTMTEWSAIDKGFGWCSDTGSYTIVYNYTGN